MINVDVDEFTCSCNRTGDPECLRCGVGLAPPPVAPAVVVPTSSEVETRPEILPPFPEVARSIETGEEFTPLPARAFPAEPRPRSRGWIVVATAVAAAAALVVALAPTAASGPHVKRVPAGTIECSGAPVETHEVDGQIAYSCRWGGRFTCEASVCGVFAWEHAEARRRWRQIHGGDVVRLPAGMDHFLGVPGAK